MASNKKGFDYYNTDTDRYSDIRIKKLKRNNGCAGIAVYDYILCEIYRVEGCFLQWDESTVFDVAEYFGLKESCVNEIVSYCCAVGLFDKELFTNGNIITSQSIQRRFVDMCRRAKRSNINIPEKYNILPEEYRIIQEEYNIIPEERRIIPEECRRVEKSIVDNNTNPPITPNGVIPPAGGTTDREPDKKQKKKSEHKTLNGRARDIFERFYRKKFDIAYYWTAKDAGSMKDICQKIAYQRREKKLSEDDESILNALEFILENTDDEFIVDNMDVSMVNSNMNRIMKKIKQKNGSKKEQPTRQYPVFRATTE